MKFTTLRSVLAALFMCIGMIGAQAQSNPTPYALSSGTYTFTTWAAANAALTYPANMMFHQFSNFNPTPTQLPNKDWDCAYNLTAGPRFNGTGANGITMSMTGSGSASGCGGTSGSAVGAVVLGLNATGRTNITVNWLGGTATAGQRFWALRLQYRLTSTGTWTDVVDASNNPVEYVCNATSGHTQTFTTILPPVCENQSDLQVRWTYYEFGGSGTRPTVRLDEIAVSSSAGGGTPTKFAIAQISPAAPSSAGTFTVLVRSVDAGNAPQNVSSATSFNLALSTGSGSLSGTVTGTIPAGTSYAYVNGVGLTTVQTGAVIRASRTAGDVLADGFSAPFAIQQGATSFLVNNWSDIGYVNTPFQTFTASAIRSDNSVDAGYASNITVSKVSGPGNLVFTPSVAAVAGVATFNNISVDAAGTYVLSITAPNLGTQTLQLTVYATPTVSANILPQYLSANNSVVPSYALVTFSNLRPNTQYRFNTGGANDNVLTSTGPGLNNHYNQNDQTYYFSFSKNFSTIDYSVFSTGPGQTSKSVWVNLVPSTSSTFAEGATIFWRIALGDHLGRLIRYYELPGTSLSIRQGTASNQATGIADPASQATPKNVIVLYDNEAGTGRPLSSAIVQNDGTLATVASTFYQALENTTGAWATIIPNTLPNGVRRIEERDGVTGNLVYVQTSSTGVWNGISTVNRAGGDQSPVYLETPQITVSTPVDRDTLCTGSTYDIKYNARGVAGVRIQLSRSGGQSWEDITTVTFGGQQGGATTGQNTYRWTLGQSTFNSTFRIRVMDINNTLVGDSTGNFTVVAPLTVLGNPSSSNLCLDDSDTLIALTTGSVRSYQWFKDGVAIPNANSALFVINDAHYGTSGVYVCEVRGYGKCGNVTTTPAHIRVGRATSISAQSMAVPTTLGGKATLSVTAEAPEEVLTYQWYNGTTRLVEGKKYFGTTSNRLEINNITASDISNDYYVVVSGICGVAQSRNIKVFTAGVYTEFGATTVDACVGGTVTLAAQAYSNPEGRALNIQWFRNGSRIVDGGKYSGATTSTLVITGTETADAGVYTVRAELVGDASQNAEAMITVAIATTPVITRQPSAVEACDGATATLGVTATAQGTISYQWLKDGVEISGATSNDYVIPTVTSARAGQYTVRVQTACGNILSDPAALSVKAAAVITVQPVATIQVQEGTDLQLSVQATGPGTLQYQWFKDGNPIAAAVTPTFNKTAVVPADAGLYWVRVRSECGDLISDTTTVTTRPATSVDDEVVAGGALISRIAPNPVQSLANFTIMLAAPQHVTVSLVNAAGVVVATVTNEVLPAGLNTVGFETSTLSSGFYQLVTVVGTERAAQAVVIVK